MKSLIIVVALLALINLVTPQVYDDSQREGICVSTLKECIQACYCQEKEKPKINKCDPKTFEYRCTCPKGYIPPTTNTTFQAFFASCNIKHNECRDKCKGDSICAQECQKKFNCLPSPDSDKGCKVNSNSSSTSQILRTTEISYTSKKLYENSSSAIYINPFSYSYIVLTAGLVMTYLVNI